MSKWSRLSNSEKLKILDRQLIDYWLNNPKLNPKDRINFLLDLPLASRKSVSKYKICLYPKC